MKKRIIGEIVTKAKKRELKKRPRMKIHGQSLKQAGSHAGKKIARSHIPPLKIRGG